MVRNFSFLSPVALEVDVTAAFDAMCQRSESARHRSRLRQLLFICVHRLRSRRSKCTCGLRDLRGFSSGWNSRSALICHAGGKVLCDKNQKNISCSELKVFASSVKGDTCVLMRGLGCV
jgi:hypothetical protein